MAFPTSYTGWIAYVRNWIGADDYSDAQVGQFLDLAQVRLNTDLMSYPMEKLYRHVVTSSEVGTFIDLNVAIPDFSKVRLVSVPGVGSLDVAAVNEFIDRASEIANGYYTSRGVYNIDAGRLSLWPWPASDVVVDIHYYEMVPSLGTSRNSNTFTRYHQDLLLYAACLEASSYMVEDERIPVWESKYSVGVLTANAAAAKIKMGSTPLRRDVKTMNWGVQRTGPITAAGGGVTPVPPTNTLAPVLSQTTADTSDVISCTTGTWAASPTSYEYQWMRDGVDIVGSTVSLYSTTSLDDGTTLTCKVRALNADGASDYVVSSNACVVSTEVVPVVGSSYFPDRYFGTRYFGRRYFG